MRLGLGLGMRRPRGSGGGAVAYKPGAVALTPQFSLLATQLAVTNSSVGLLFAWLKTSVGSQAVSAVAPFGWGAFNGDFVTNRGTTQGSELVPGINWTNDVNGARFNWNDATGGSGHSINGVATGPNPMQAVNEVWVPYFIAWDFTAAGRKGVMFIGNTQVGSFNVADIGAVTSPFLAAVNQAQGFGIGGFSATNGSIPPIACGMSQLWADFHTTGLLSTGTLTAATLAKFITTGGAPVDLGLTATPKGSLPFGTQPELYFDCAPGGEATWNVNLGSAGQTFAITRNANVSASEPVALQQAATGPSGPWNPARPAVKWIAPGNPATATTAVTVTNNANPIAIGDTLLICLKGVDNSGTATKVITPPGSFVPLFGGSFNVNDGVDYNSNQIVGTYVATAAVAAGVDWTGYTFNWATAPGRSQSWVVINLGQQVGGAAWNVQAAAKTSANTANMIAPTVTPTSAVSLLISLFGVFDPSQVGVTTLPAGQSLRFKNPFTSGATYTLVGDEPITGTTATGPRMATQATGHAAWSANLIIGS